MTYPLKQSQEIPHLQNDKPPIFSNKYRDEIIRIEEIIREEVLSHEESIRGELLKIEKEAVTIIKTEINNKNEQRIREAVKRIEASLYNGHKFP